jgi:hypothetical protein
MSQELTYAYEQELNDNLFVLELEERLEMVQAPKPPGFHRYQLLPRQLRCGHYGGHRGRRKPHRVGTRPFF